MGRSFCHTGASSRVTDSNLQAVTGQLKIARLESTNNDSPASRKGANPPQSPATIEKQIGKSPVGAPPSPASTMPQRQTLQQQAPRTLPEGDRDQTLSLRSTLPSQPAGESTQLLQQQQQQAEEHTQQQLRQQQHTQQRPQQQQQRRQQQQQARGQQVAKAAAAGTTGKPTSKAASPRGHPSSSRAAGATLTGGLRSPLPQLSHTRSSLLGPSPGRFGLEARRNEITKNSNPVENQGKFSNIPNWYSCIR